MKAEEIKKLLCFSENESKVFMPNEIFDDFKNISQKNAKKESKAGYITFAYAYYYLISWLFRYAKYGSLTETINQKLIKKVLGFNENYRESNFIIKKNGLLDQWKYTETIKDFPLEYELDDNFIEFTMYSDLEDETKKLINVGKNFTISFPVKAFYRDEQSMNDNVYDGTFYEVEKTHCIPFEVFMYCMSNKDIGCKGFYLYCYFKWKNDQFPEGFNIPFEKLETETGIPQNTAEKYLDILRKYNMVTGTHQQGCFSHALSREERKANRYNPKFRKPLLST